MDFSATKSAYAGITQRGINNILGGVILWTAFGVLSLLLPERLPLTNQPHEAIVYLLGAGLLFPLGLLIGQWMGIDTFAKGHPMSLLSGLIGGLQILFIPVMLGAYFKSPENVPWYLASLVGAHFLPFYWVYDSVAYLIGAFGLVAVAVVAGLFAPALTFVIVPFGVALVLLVVALRKLARSRTNRCSPPDPVAVRMMLALASGTPGELPAGRRSRLAGGRPAPGD